MNSLKKIAAVSGIVFVITLILSIVLTPFAVSSSIDIYNDLLARAEENSESYWFRTDVDSAVKELVLAHSGYYGEIVVKESPDNEIHIKNQDNGFSYIKPELDIRGDKAQLNFIWVNDPKLTEENVLQFLASEFYDNYRYRSVIELPASASLRFAEENMEDLFYNVRFEYTGFANYAELQSLQDGWAAVLEARSVYDEHQNIVLSVLNDISQQRESIAWAAEDCTNVEEFQEVWAVEYINIKEQRSDLLKRTYNFRKEYSTQPAEELESTYLELNNVIVELCEYEKEYDLLTAQVAEARANLNSGYINYNAQRYEKLSESAYDRQVELDLSISKLREKLSAYLLERFMDAEEVPVVVPADAETPVEETPPAVPAETTENTTETITDVYTAPNGVTTTATQP